MFSNMENEKDLDFIVWSLAGLGAPRDFIHCVVLIYFTKGLYDLDEEFHWLEFFAGFSACTRAIRRKGLMGARFDINFVKNTKGRKSNWMDFLTSSGLLLGVVYILKMRPDDAVAWFAMKCSSLVHMNSGTSRRSPCDAAGNLDAPSVSYTNALLERVICLMMLVSAVRGTWCLEQPGSSVLEFYPAFLHFITYHYRFFRTTQSVWKVKWWMGCYGGKSPKRQYGYSSSRAILRLDVGWKRVMKTRVKTVKHYTNKNGARKYVGTKHLRETERYPEPFGEAVARIHQDLAHVGPSRLPPIPQPLALEVLRNGSVSSEADSLFANAKFGDAVEYLLNGKHLQLPKHWQDYFSSV